MSSTDSAPELARRAAAQARDELAAALDQIEDAFDVTARAKEIGTKAAEIYRRNPVPWLVAGAAVAVAAVGLVAWAILSDE